MIGDFFVPTASYWFIMCGGKEATIPRHCPDTDVVALVKRVPCGSPVTSSMFTTQNSVSQHLDIVVGFAVKNRGCSFGSARRRPAPPHYTSSPRRAALPASPIAVYFTTGQKKRLILTICYPTTFLMYSSLWVRPKRHPIPYIVHYF